MTGDGQMSRDFGLTNQLRRAAVSVMSNIAEGFESNTTRSFLRYLRIAKASLAEVRCQLYVAVDTGSIPPTRHTQLTAQVDEVAPMLGGRMRSLNRHLGGQSLK
jgi:four helix bundle protein